MDVKLASDFLNTPIPPGFVLRVDKSPPKAPNAPPIAADLAVPKGEIRENLIASSSFCAEAKREILNLCKETKCELKILPGAYQFVQGEVSLAQIKDVTVEDLLGRDTIQVDMEQIFQYIKGKTILVTGGGGSIGSELCRQIASHEPKQLILFDIYENNAYAIEQELRRNHSELNLVTLIGSVRDSRRLNQVFKKFKPHFEYHAAAHKHVPLMETSPNEAIKNNVIGTLKTARTASHYQVKKFILISTDKAVNPTNIMGASKRLCEMVIQLIGRHSTTEFAAVRFGNVLGSNGSVIPLFRRQIEHGGPVTVTHPDIIRYFMTIPEAVSLVLEAGAYAKNGQIFVLNMGDPVRIADLAKNMIRLSGYEPEKEIKIKYIGLRPGEKLYEELLMNEEGMQTTENSRIFIGRQIAFDEKVFREQIKELAKEAENECPDICYLVKKMVPEYQYEGEKQG